MQDSLNTQGLLERTRNGRRDRRTYQANFWLFTNTCERDIIEGMQGMI